MGAEQIAKELAQKLISIYNERKIVRYTQLNRSHPEGFTREKMRGSPDNLFRMIILAAYDRQPFTRIAEGWEPIWGLAETGPSLPAILRHASLFDLCSVSLLSHEDIQRRLTDCSFFSYKLHSDGAHTRYAYTFENAVNQVQGGLLDLIESAATSEDVKVIHRRLDDIHGIGPTIASKLVMYTLREVRLSEIDLRELYPAVMPIVAEYHNAKFANELALACGDSNLVEKVFEALKEAGDPFAIDALYYVDRDEPDLKELLMQSMRLSKSPSSSDSTGAEFPGESHAVLQKRRRTGAPPWNEREFEAILNDYRLPNEDFTGRLPARSASAIGAVRSGIHAFHRGGNISTLSRMMVDHLEEKRGSLICPVCGIRF